MSDFIEDLERLLNQHSRENDSHTPDFILADFLNDCLGAWNDAVKRREEWYAERNNRRG